MSEKPCLICQKLKSITGMSVVCATCTKRFLAIPDEFVGAEIRQPIGFRECGPEAVSDEEWARKRAEETFPVKDFANVYNWNMVCDEHARSVRYGLAEGRRREREDGVAARLASDALCAISGAGGVTPQEGYLKAPHCLQSDIERVIFQREEAAARDAWEHRQGLPPCENYSFDHYWKQRREGEK